MESGKKKLYIVTQHYPFGYAEKTFIEPELKMLIASQKFDITIISNAMKHEKRTSFVDKSVKIIWIPNKNILECPMQCIKYSLRYFFSKIGWKDIYCIIKKDGLTIGRIVNSLWYYIQASIFAESLLKKEDEFSNAIVYTYWFHTQTFGILMNAHKYNNIRVVSRIHGFDLYDEVNKYGRQPFRWYMDKKIDKLFFIAENGRKYYQGKVVINSNNSDKYLLCRLGTFSNNSYTDTWNLKKENDEFLLVSCSNIVPVKRVELIIQAIGCIKDFRLKWVHFGDGSEKEKIEEKAFVELNDKKNIKYQFMGRKENEEILQFYEKNFVDCFISTSLSEGCPVSVQEAMSYGIPVIATAVGEVPLMINGNGILLDKDCTITEIAEAIIDFQKKTETEKELMRKTSRKMWEKYFDGNMNYQLFINNLLEI